MPITVTATTATDWPLYNYLADVDLLALAETSAPLTTLTLVNNAADPAFDRKITLTGTGIQVDQNGEIWAGNISSLKITGMAGTPTYYTMTFSAPLGADVLWSAIAQLTGSNGATTTLMDNIFRNYQPYVFNGGAGDDFFEGSNFADTINGGAGDDVLIGFEGDDTINGGTGDDYIDGWLGSNTIDGGAGDDWIVTGTGNNTITGGAGADYLDGDHLGFDTVTFAKATVGVTIDAAAGTGSGGDAEGDTYIRIEKFEGSGLADKFIASNSQFALPTVYSGGKGIDTYVVTFVGILAGTVSDVDLSLNAAGRSSFGASSVDSLFEIENVTGGSGRDWIRGDILANVLDGADGDDVLEGRGGADRLIGGAGFDWATYEASATGVKVNLSLTTAQVSTGDASGDVLIGIEHLLGSAYGDTLTGNAGDNSLNGGADNDILIGGKGADKLAGAGGTDTVSYATSSAGVSIDLVTGGGTGGDAEGDIIYPDVENITGSAYADTLKGSAGINTLDGGGGNDILWDYGDNDTLYGGTGNDTLYAFGNNAQTYGGAGNDTIIGNSGLQVLRGEAGNDVIDSGGGGGFLIGGAGRDRFVHSDGYDFIFISDFQAGSKGDYLDLRGISNLTYYQQLLTPGAITQGAAGYTDINLIYFNGDSDDVIRLVSVNSSSLRPGNFILN